MSAISSTKFLEQAPLKSVKDLQTLIEQGTSREQVVCSYEKFPPAIRQGIRRSMEFISHGSVSKIDAEDVIQNPYSDNPSSAMDRELEKVNHLFYLAISHAIESQFLPQAEEFFRFQALKKHFESDRDLNTIHRAFLILQDQSKWKIAKTMYYEARANYKCKLPPADNRQKVSNWSLNTISSELSELSSRKKTEGLFYQTLEILIEMHKTDWFLPQEELFT